MKYLINISIDLHDRGFGPCPLSGECTNISAYFINNKPSIFYAYKYIYKTRVQYIDELKIR